MQYITIDELVTFPAPLEVDRELYLMIIIIGKSGSGFPAPREVVR